MCLVEEQVYASTTEGRELASTVEEAKYVSTVDSELNVLTVEEAKCAIIA